MKVFSLRINKVIKRFFNLDTNAYAAWLEIDV